MAAAPPEPPPAWLELAVTCDSEAVEAVSEILARVAPAVSVEPAFVLTGEGLVARLDPTRPTTVRACLPLADRPATEAAVAATVAALGHLQAFGLGSIGELVRREVDDAAWADAWKAHFAVLRVGRHLVIRPTWRRHRRTPGDVVVILDPGMAFGTGLHPTTRLCLQAVEDLATAGRLAGARVLDLGCGSGILGLAAARLGARDVVALDPDPIAVTATGENARRNRLGARVHARLGSLPAPGEPYDLVLANLIASLLVTLAAPLARAVRPGGMMVAGGVFADREPEVRRALAAGGLRITGRLEEGDWVTLLAERPVPRPVPGPVSGRPLVASCQWSLLTTPSGPTRRPRPASSAASSPTRSQPPWSTPTTSCSPCATSRPARRRTCC